MTQPLPVFALLRGPATERALGALRTDPRLEFVVGNDKKTNWVMAAQRTSALIVVSPADPLSSLLYAISAGVTIPVIVAAPKRFAGDRRDVIDAGGAALVNSPISKPDVGRIMKLLSPLATGVHVDGRMHLVLDPIGRVVRLHAKSVRLSQREFEVLHCLTSREGRPVSATDVLAYVWGDNPRRVQSREILDVYIFNLRKKLKKLGLSDAIRTVRSYGYALVPSTSKD